MIVGVCRLSLYFSESGSLKSKRQPLRKVIDRLRAKFNVAVAEVAEQDTWKRATVGLAVVGNESRHVQSMLDTIIGFVEQMYVAEILDRQTELVSYSDGERLDLPLWNRGGLEGPRRSESVGAPPIDRRRRDSEETADVAEAAEPAEVAEQAEEEKGRGPQ